MAFIYGENIPDATISEKDTMKMSNKMSTKKDADKKLKNAKKFQHVYNSSVWTIETRNQYRHQYSDRYGGNLVLTSLLMLTQLIDC